MDPRALATAKLCGINDPELLDKFNAEFEKLHAPFKDKENQNSSKCPMLQFLSDIKQARLISRMVKSAMPGTDNLLVLLNTKLQPEVVGVIPYAKINNICQQIGLSPADPLMWAAEKSTVYFPCLVFYERTEDKKCVAMQFRLPYIDMTVVEDLVKRTGVTEEGAIMKELLERFIHCDLFMRG